MEIRKVEKDKKKYLALLLLADEQEDMIDRYLERGTMYVLEDGEVKAECVVADEGDGVLELKNIAVEPDFQGQRLWESPGGLPHSNLRGTVYAATGGYWGQPLHHPVLRELRLLQASSGQELFH